MRIWSPETVFSANLSQNRLNSLLRTALNRIPRSFLCGIIAPLLLTQGVAAQQCEGMFLMQVYENRDLRGEPAIVACAERRIEENWGTKAAFKKDTPADGFLTAGQAFKDNFSVRWSGVFEFDGGQYQFKVGADDGIRLMLDGGTVLSQWKDHRYKEYDRTLTVMRGRHRVVVEYYENLGHARVLVSWSPLSR